MSLTSSAKESIFLLSFSSTASIFLLSFSFTANVFVYTRVILCVGKCG